ncbi:hypothetical protein ACLOJK_034939 [Asimina triloba]
MASSTTSTSAFEFRKRNRGAANGEMKLDRVIWDWPSSITLADDEGGAHRCCPDDIDGDDCRRAGARSSTDDDDSRTELMVGQFAAGGRRVDGEMGFNPSKFGRSCWPASNRMDPGH